MFRTLARLRRNIRKSPRVADESILAGGGMNIRVVVVGEVQHHQQQQQQQTGQALNKFSTVVSLVLVPFSMFACLSQPHVNGADGMWASASEVNHLMVNDSMRYAILM
ncbi:hypothetical protein LINGRAHAP2_LOCUS35770 [Linum grandiflorum]